ncbi:MAG: T9SS type A sorting domain-containing protein, partial [Bacteroidota bacterium]
SGKSGWQGHPDNFLRHVFSHIEYLSALQIKHPDIYADVYDWLGQGVDIRVFDLQGRQILNMRENVTEEIVRVPLPAGLAGGMYIMQVTGDDGDQATIRFEKY